MRHKIIKILRKKFLICSINSSSYGNACFDLLRYYIIGKKKNIKIIIANASEIEKFNLYYLLSPENNLLPQENANFLIKICCYIINRFKLYDHHYYNIDFRKFLSQESINLKINKTRRYSFDFFINEYKIQNISKIVVIHIRNSSDKIALKHDLRNNSTKNYTKVISYLISLNYFVIRIGDPKMDKIYINDNKFIDLPFTKYSNTNIELDLIKRSSFFIACDSGPYMLPFFFNVPLIIVNVINIFSLFPLRRFDYFIFKKIYDNKGNLLNIESMLDNPYLKEKFSGVYKIEENSEDDILCIVKDFLNLQNKSDKTTYQTKETLKVVECLSSITKIYEQSNKFKKVWGTSKPFIGSGSLSSSFSKKNSLIFKKRRTNRSIT